MLAGLRAEEIEQLWCEYRVDTDGDLYGRESRLIPTGRSQSGCDEHRARPAFADPKEPLSMIESEHTGLGPKERKRCHVRLLFRRRYLQHHCGHGLLPAGSGALL